MIAAPERGSVRFKEGFTYVCRESDTPGLGVSHFAGVVCLTRHQGWEH